MSFPLVVFSVTLNLVHFAPPTHPIYRSVDFFKKLVESRTGGRIRVINGGFKLFGDEFDKLNGVMDGRYQMCIVTTSLLANRVPEFLICDMPFIWPNRKKLYEVLDGPLMDIFSGKVEELGLVLLGWCENDFREFSNNKRPIYRPEDMAGLRIRTLNSELYADMYKSLGVKPVFLKFSKILPALKKGEIDGVDLPIPVSFISGFLGYQRYVTVSNWSYMGCAILANKLWLSKLPEDLREAVVESAYEMAVVERAMTMEDMMKTLDKVEDAGIKVNWLNGEEKRLFRLSLAKFYRKWARRIGLDTFKQVWDILGYPKLLNTSP